MEILFIQEIIAWSYPYHQAHIPLDTKQMHVMCCILFCKVFVWKTMAFTVFDRQFQV